MKNLFLFLLGIIIGAIAVYFYCCQPANLESSIIEPKGLITPAEAKVLDQAFNSRHQLISDSIVKRPDNRSSWYSLDDIRNYLSYAENQATELGYKMDGVRLYLGAYPTDKEVGYTTMFFIPTGTVNNKNSEGSMLNFYLQGGSGDIKGGNGLNMGDPGNPPFGNYPQ